MDDCGLPISNTNFEDLAQPQERFPKQGLVNQVCREWLVHEDGALAYRLQEKEIEMHYGKNREQRKTIRMDFEQAKCLQEVDDEDTAVTLSDYDIQLLRQELEDERVAKELQEQIEREEALHNRILEQADKELARKLQDGESRHGIKGRNTSGESHDACRSRESGIASKDLAKCYEDTLSRATRHWSLENGDDEDLNSSHDRISNASESENVAILQDLGLPSPNVEELRRLQEVKDQKLALTIQNEEVTATSQYYTDQQLAIQVQDRELAKMLQEKERLRAKKVRQKARAQKLKSVEDSDEGSRPEVPVKGDIGWEKKHTTKREQNYFHRRDIPHQNSNFATNKPTLHNRSPTSPFSMQSPHRVDGPQFPKAKHLSSLERLPNSSSSRAEVQNVAVDIDPTFYHEYTTIKSKSSHQIPPSPVGHPCESQRRSTPTQTEISEDDRYSDDDLAAAPPYMPIQGQKRQTIDKRKKKDGCKQQ